MAKLNCSIVSVSRTIDWPTTIVACTLRLVSGRAFPRHRRPHPAVCTSISTVPAAMAVSTLAEPGHDEPCLVGEAYASMRGAASSSAIDALGKVGRRRHLLLQSSWRTRWLLTAVSTRAREQLDPHAPARQAPRQGRERSAAVRPKRRSGSARSGRRRRVRPRTCAPVRLSAVPARLRDRLARPGSSPPVCSRAMAGLRLGGSAGRAPRRRPRAQPRVPATSLPA